MSGSDEFSVSLISPGAGGEICLDDIAGVAPMGVDALLLPELWSGADPDVSERRLEDLSRLCENRRMFAISGGMPWREDGRLFLRTWILDDSGAKLARYDRAHLSSRRGEDGIYSRGGGAEIFMLGGAVCAALSGYDLLFPEFCRQISLAGAQIFLVSSSRGDELAGMREPVIRSAAFVNQCFVAICGGGSAVAAPSGEIIAEGRGDEVLTVSLRISEAARQRKSFPLERDRRGEIYALFP